jgi:hypothetical protein
MAHALAHGHGPRGHKRQWIAVRDLVATAVALPVEGKIERERGDAALLQRTSDRLRHALLARREPVQQQGPRCRACALRQQERGRHALAVVHEIEQPLLASRRRGSAPSRRGEAGTSHGAPRRKFFAARVVASTSHHH